MTIKNNFQAIQLLDESPQELQETRGHSRRIRLRKQLTQALMERGVPSRTHPSPRAHKARSVQQKLAQQRRRHGPEDRSLCKELLRAAVRDRLREV